MLSFSKTFSTPCQSRRDKTIGRIVPKEDIDLIDGTYKKRVFNKIKNYTVMFLEKQNLLNFMKLVKYNFDK